MPYIIFIRLYESLPQHLFFQLLLYVSILGFIYALSILLSKILFYSIKDDFNNYYDRFIPLMLLILPIIVSLLLDLPVFGKILSVAGIYFCLILPSLYFYKALRNWEGDPFETISWSHPQIYINICESAIYPLLFGLYISIIRYSRLNSYVNVLDIILEWHNPITWLLATCGFWPIFLMAFMEKVNQIKQYYWDNFTSIMRAINIVLLQYKMYFFIVKKLHKYCYLFYVIVSNHLFVFPHTMQNYKFTHITKLRYYIVTLLTKCYVNINKIGYLLFLILFIELIITQGKLYYSLYCLFIFPLIYAIGRFILFISQYDLGYNVCYSDYLYKNWFHSHYPYTFYAYIGTPDMYPFVWDFSEFKQDELSEIQDLHTNYQDKFQKISTLHVSSPRLDVLFNKITNTSTSFITRLRIHYRISFGLRWVHEKTTKTLQAMPLLHKGIGFFIKNNIYSQTALMQFSWHPHYQTLLSNALPHTLHKPDNFYTPLPPRYQQPEQYASIESFMENNAMLRFVPYAEYYQFFVSLFPQRTKFNALTRQSEPDLNFDVQKSWLDFLDNVRSLGFTIDQKNLKKFGIGANMLTTLSFDKYSKLLHQHQMYYFKANPDLSNDEKKVFVDCYANLRRTFGTDEYVKYWLLSTNIFKLNLLPPCNLSSESVDDTFFTEETKALLIRAKTIIQIINYELYSNNIPQNHSFNELRNICLKFRETTTRGLELVELFKDFPK